jgi:hypothetical protein
MQIGLVGHSPLIQCLFDAYPGSVSRIVACLLAEQVLQTDRAVFASFHGGQSVRITTFFEPSEQAVVPLKGRHLLAG